MEDANRVFPGDGVVELRPVLAALKRKDYAGALSIEVWLSGSTGEWGYRPAGPAGSGEVLEVCRKVGVDIFLRR